MLNGLYEYPSTEALYSINNKGFIVSHFLKGPHTVKYQVKDLQD